MSLQQGSCGDRGAYDALRRLAGRGVSWSDLERHLPPGSRPRAAAVLILFGPLDDRPAQHAGTAVPDDLDVLLVRRASTLTHHPNQVSFPGGRIDPTDDGPVDAALREAVEETGLDRTGVEVLGTLDVLPLPVSNHLVTPVLAWWRRPSPVGVVDEAESAHVFRAPVLDLLDPANRGVVEITRAGRHHASPAFTLDTHVVWGFTGLVLSRLFDELGWTEPWDQGRTIDLPG